MSSPKIYGICLVKNEDDVIAQSLTFATRNCERVFVLDNGSTDATWRILLQLASQHSAIVPFAQTDEPFDNGLRAQVYNAIRREISDRDWWLILDADEFLADDPRAIVEIASGSGADAVNSWQIQFCFTERDLELWNAGRDSRERPIYERRRHYSIDWQETRLFRNNRREPWNPRLRSALPNTLTRLCSRRVFNRHYQYRDPEQITKRLLLRYGHDLFPHVDSPNWQAFMRPSRKLQLHHDGDPWRFSFSGLSAYYRTSWRERVRSASLATITSRLQRFMARAGSQKDRLGPGPESEMTGR